MEFRRFFKIHLLTWLPAVFHNRIQLNPDPAKNLNPDSDPEDLERIQAIS